MWRIGRRTFDGELIAGTRASPPPSPARHHHHHGRQRLILCDRRLNSHSWLQARSRELYISPDSAMFYSRVDGVFNRSVQ
jgi:hypothetical protein